MYFRSRQSRVAWSLLTIVLCAVSLAGCGVISQTRTVFPDEIVGADGQRITRAQIDGVIQDDELNSAGREEALRELGLQDERLIDILLR